MINKNDYLNLEQDEINLRFTESCEKGNLEQIKYLLTSEDLKNKANIHVKNDYGLITACYFGHLDIVKYLLTSPELKEHADINSKKDSGLRISCLKGNLELVKYLLTSPELKKHAKLHTDNYYCFKQSAKRNHLEIINFFIFDLNIKNGKNIQNYLQKNPNPQIENMFKLRELNKQLGEDLKSAKIKIKKVKL